jgi:imidazolonepropionase-like amidohydrolase
VTRPSPALALLAATLLALLTACTGGQAERPPPPGPMVLEHVALIDGLGGPVLADRTILIAEGRIAAVYPSGSRPAPAGAERLDLTGRTVIPGLIDAHVHLATRQRDEGMIEQILANVLADGVTTVRDMGGNGVLLTRLAARAESADARSPHILLSTLITGPSSEFWMSGGPGTFVANGGAPGTQAWFRRVRAPGEIEAAIRGARAFGATGVKLHSGFDADMLRLIGAAARRHGLRVWAHAYGDPARPSEIAAAASILSHADMLAYEGLGARPEGFAALPYVERTRIAMAATPVDGPALGRLFGLMRARHVCLEPTLFVMEPRVPDPAMTAYVRYAAAATARAHRAGVMICAGTDAIGGSTSNLPAELALLVERAGLSPIEAISAATRTNARALGLTDRGAVAPGLRADLVVLAANPAADIANLRRVEMVIKGGRTIRPEARARERD